jgi:polyisoprenoid-binding protein YceI
MSAAEPATADTVTFPTGTWKIDPVHSSVEFQVKHLGIATVKGQFKEFEGTLESTPAGLKAEGSVNVASVDTREPQRDGHLRSPDFFDAETYPHIRFSSSSVRPIDEDTFEVEGDFTIRDVTRPLKLIVELEGTETDHEGHERVGLSASATINRSDFGMKFNMALGSGNVVVGDKVKIVVDVSAVKSA